MKNRAKLCNIINLLWVLIAWAVIITVPNILAGRILPWWANGAILVAGLPVAGYIVDHFLSARINRFIMRGHESKRED